MIRLTTCLLGLLGLLAACRSDEQLPDMRLEVRRLDRLQQLLGRQPDPTACYRLYLDSLAAERKFLAGWMLGTTTAYFDSIDAQRIDTSLGTDLCQWTRDPNTQQLLDSVRAVWPDSVDLVARLRPAFQRLRLYFADTPEPRIRTLAWGYDRNRPWEHQFLGDRFYLDSAWVGIGLDYFSGPRFPYLHPQMPQYVRSRCRPELLPAALVEALIRRRQPPLTDAQMPALLDRMVHAGIRLYAVQRILPALPDSLLLGWTTAHTATVQREEAALYARLVPLLFDQNPRAYDWATREGPFTQRLGQDYPARIGEYIGLQIVRRYAEAYPTLTLADLLRITDARKLFELSGYKPR